MCGPVGGAPGDGIGCCVVGEGLRRAGAAAGGTPLRVDCGRPFGGGWRRCGRSAGIGRSPEGWPGTGIRRVPLAGGWRSSPEAGPSGGGWRRASRTARRGWPPRSSRRGGAPSRRGRPARSGG
ncbi:hypothetical protein [Amycolatopsis sulphurea]|uniref:hypothetical protein n=1 Tax=Amycolatopsis sulphurea TaxID=76022 RepID=UPI001472FBE1|nr:hypothetical protein [Amycolatopsis sulphurea]